ncbi:MAG: pyridoxal phosphate-dependent aminotransferase family protein [Cytophagales bacterium]|nr:MAG: pyridoxal phosphate-dependent aminotransferase family protein [Cytophagales bacterium]
MSQNWDFQALVMDEMSRYGTAFGSSRNGNLQLRVYEEGEATLAGWTSAPAALTVSSGMMAGQVVMQWLASQAHTRVVYAPHTHPALWHTPTLAMPTSSFADWSAQLPDQMAQLPEGPLVIALNSVDAGHSEMFDFEWIKMLPSDRPLTLVVDDSHGIGVLGNEGRGVWARLSGLVPPSVRLIVTASLAKAMGLPGGLILSDADTLGKLRHTSFFGGASPMAPAPLAAFGRAGALYADAHERLSRNVRLAEAVLGPTGLFRQAAGYPVFYTDHNELYAPLLARNILIYSFAYPTPQDKPNTRLVVSAFHEDEDFERLGECLNKGAYNGFCHPEERGI